MLPPMVGLASCHLRNTCYPTWESAFVYVSIYEFKVCSCYVLLLPVQGASVQQPMPILLRGVVWAHSSCGVLIVLSVSLHVPPRVIYSTRIPYCKNQCIL